MNFSGIQEHRGLSMGLAHTLLVLVALIRLYSGVLSAQPNPGMDPCSRVLARLATPVGVEATPERGGARLAVSQTVMNFTSCFNRRNLDGVLALTGDAFRQSFIGVSNPEDIRTRLELLEHRGLLPEIQIQSIEENGTTGVALATLVVTWQGWNGLHRELWRLHNLEKRWVLDGRSIQPPQVGGVAAGIQLIIERSGLTAPATQVMNPGTIIVAFSNQLDMDRTALVLAAPPDATVGSVVDQCNDRGAERLSPAGSIGVEAGTVALLPLMNLPPGRYALVEGDDPCAGSETIAAAQVALLDVTE